MEAIRSSETSVDTRSTQRHIPENGILHSHRCEHLRSYTDPIFLAIFSEGKYEAFAERKPTLSVA
jgi:hypothetical protein